MSGSDYDASDNARKCYDVAIEAMREKLASFRKQTFLDEKVSLFCGDCLEVLKLLPDASIDSVVCDPPYHLTTGKKGGVGVASLNLNSPAGRSRISTGFMGKAWDGGDIAFRIDLWKQVLRVLKPGGHLLAFSGTRTYHRMACAIEDAGFEIRDQIGWAYGSGFPKSHDVSKGIDKRAGAERAVIRERYTAKRIKPGATVVKEGAYGKQDVNFTASDTVPATEQPAQWQGWGTQLKPAWEPICVARRPLVGTVVENVLAHGTGALNIDACRIEGDGAKKWETPRGGIWQTDAAARASLIDNPQGRWPANIVHDGSDEVLGQFPETQSGDFSGTRNTPKFGNVYHPYIDDMGTSAKGWRGSIGSAARFFYTAKADAEDRLGSKHPTVKPLDLMQWLVRLVTPKGGTVLDPFAGTGTTGEAAWREGMKAILIEREEEYQADIARRMELAANPTKRAAVAATKNKLDRPEDLPLFKEAAE